MRLAIAALSAVVALSMSVAPSSHAQNAAITGDGGAPQRLTSPPAQPRGQPKGQRAKAQPRHAGEAAPEFASADTMLAWIDRYHLEPTPDRLTDAGEGQFLLIKFGPHPDDGQQGSGRPGEGGDGGTL